MAPKKSFKHQAKTSLKKFLEFNPYSEVETIKVNGKEETIVVNPWGDETLKIVIPEKKTDKSKLVRVLNKLWLPERFTAIYHKDKNSLEVLWTAYKTSQRGSEVVGRSFDFHFKELVHRCEFKRSSDRLINLAKYTLPRTAPSHTNHRNMISFYRYATGQNIGPIDKPISFWIHSCPDDSELLINLVKHLNFYMEYYDSSTPTILIHQEQVNPQVPVRNRYRHGNFPKQMRAKQLDENLLVFWQPPVGADNITRFLHSYKIIEYSAHQYIADQTRARLQRVLNRPDALDDINTLFLEVSGSFNESDLDQHQKAKKLLREVVNLDLVWREVEKNKDSFAQRLEFDGGFKTKNSLISEQTTKETFSQDCLLNFYERAKEIRNALSHGKDIESRGSILPTRANEQKLRPWVNLLEIISGEIILNKDLK